MFELRLEEEKIIYEGENEPPHYELELIGSFTCNEFSECLDKIVELYEPEMTVTIVEADSEKTVLKIVGEKLVYLNRRFMEEAVEKLPIEFFEPDEDELRICREEDRTRLPSTLINGKKFYDQGSFLFSEDCSMVIRVNWP